MSVEMMSRVFSDSQSRGAQRLVLLALADEASRDGEISAYRRSQSWLMEKCNLSRAGVQKALRELVELRELVVTEAGDGRHQASYRITIEGLIPYAPERSTVSPRGLPGEPPSSRSLPVEPVTSCPTPSDDDRFDRFWKVYPRKEGKKAARSAFKSMIKRKHLDEARKALPLHIAMWREQGRPTSAIPHAATWLNGERYLDELTHFDAPQPGKHRDAGKIFYNGDNTRYRVEDDGSRTQLGSEDDS